MMVSTKGRYALRVMIDLAEHQSEGYVPLKEIAARQEISEKYLESILKVLVQQRFLEGLRWLQADPRAGNVHRGQHSAPDGGQPGNCCLPGRRCPCLPAHGGMPHLSAVVQAGRYDQRIPGQRDTGRPDAVPRCGQRICDLSRCSAVWQAGHLLFYAAKR